MVKAYLVVFYISLTGQGATSERTLFDDIRVCEQHAQRINQEERPKRKLGTEKTISAVCVPQGDQ